MANGMKDIIPRIYKTSDKPQSYSPSHTQLLGIHLCDGRQKSIILDENHTLSYADDDHNCDSSSVEEEMQNINFAIKFQIYDCDFLLMHTNTIKKSRDKEKNNLPQPIVSSEPSSQSGLESHFHRIGMHLPSLHVVNRIKPTDCIIKYLYASRFVRCGFYEAYNLYLNYSKAKRVNRTKNRNQFNKIKLSIAKSKMPKTK
ncbi:hypothetical protein FF38_10427 [Lucilia cuprina]|uniref:Uncharacterized protein n=1 Tax=Lucilia cuprina TaxID=7375 RepID=A0A0L0CHD4_LUCCU|nr:hypothetical protein FF38_10427 [Lucilia cuprina]